MDVNRGNRKGFGPAGSGARQRRTRASQPRPADRRGLWVLLAVAGIVGLVFLVLRTNSSSDTSSASDPSRVASVERPDYLRQDEKDLEAALPPTEPEDEAELELESEPLAESEPWQNPREGIVAPAPPRPPASASARALAAPPHKVAKARVEEKKAPSDEKNTFFTLVLSGDLGGEALNAQDSQTWARLAYALRDEAQVPHFLAYPGGRTPTVIPPKSLIKAANASRPKPVVQPSGDPKSPAYRIVLKASVASAGGITFYGKKLGDRHTATLVARVEKRVGEEFVEVKTIFHTEELTGGGTGSEGTQTFARKMYDVALDKLAQKLVQIPMLSRA